MDIMPPTLIDFPLLKNTDVICKEPSDTSVAQSQTGNKDWTDGLNGNLTGWSRVNKEKQTDDPFTPSLCLFGFQFRLLT